MSKLWNEMSLELASKQIDGVLKLSGSMHQQLHIAACSAMLHLLVHKNSTPMLKLFVGLSGTSIHVAGVKRWITMVGKVTLNKNTEGVLTIVFPKDYTLKETVEATKYLKAVKTFWELSPPPNPFKGWSYADELARLNKKAADMARAKEEGTLKVKGEIIELTPEQIETINLSGYESTATH